MTNKKKKKNPKPIPDPDLEYIAFKGNANKLKKGNSIARRFFHE